MPDHWQDPRAAWAELVAAVLLAIITWVDYATGYELGLFIFYFAPVALAAWVGGRRPGVLFAVGSAICWYLSDRLAGHPYSKAYFIYWETLMRLVSFLTTALTLAAIRREGRRRENLLRVVARDLRGPLGALAGQARLLREPGGEAALTASRAEAILRSARSLERTVADLLDAARWESKKLRLALEPVDLAAWLPACLQRLREALDVGRVDLALPDRPARATVDPERLERMLASLLASALASSPPEVRVRLAVQARGDGGATLEVSEPGSGTAQESAPGRAEQPLAPGSAPDGEAGPPLSGARLLAAAHGGRLRVERGPSGGATLLVDLPA